MARSEQHGLARTARWLAAFASTAVLLGVGTPVLNHAASTADVRSDAGLSPAGLAALASAATRVSAATPTLHPSVPRGYRAPVAPATAPPPAATPAAPAPPPEPAPAPDPGPAPKSPAPTAVTGLPLPVDTGPSTQVVTVVAPSHRATTATLTAWQLTASGWTAVVGPVTARVGAAGVGQASETTSRTPAGTFTLTEGFGRAADPGTALPYRVIDRQDWWVSDVRSNLYNQHTRCAVHHCPFDEAAGENLWAEGWVYRHALVIDYNRGGTPGAGSAFFLHVKNGSATAGCVAVDDGALTAIMRWLDPAARPLIAIGVG